MTRATRLGSKQTARPAGKWPLRESTTLLDALWLEGPKRLCCATGSFSAPSSVRAPASLGPAAHVQVSAVRPEIKRLADVQNDNLWLTQHVVRTPTRATDYVGPVGHLLGLVHHAPRPCLQICYCDKQGCLVWRRLYVPGLQCSSSGA